MSGGPFDWNWSWEDPPGTPELEVSLEAQIQYGIRKISEILKRRASKWFFSKKVEIDSVHLLGGALYENRDFVTRAMAVAKDFGYRPDGYRNGIFRFVKI